MDELEEFSREFKRRLDDAGGAKVVPEDLALEVQKESFPMNQQSARVILFLNLFLCWFYCEGIISRSREAAESSRGFATIQGYAVDSKL